MITVIERARRYIDKMAPAVAGAGGHDATFAVAAVLVNGFSLPPGDALALLQEYNSRCSPPWSQRDLEYKLRSAAATPSMVRGSGYLLNDALPSVRSTTSAPANTASFSEMYARMADTVRPAVAYDAKALKAAAGNFRATLPWFAARSYRDPSLVTSEDFLGLIYNNDKVVIFTDEMSQGHAVWPDDPLPAPGPRGCWYLTQPVDGRFHDNPRTGNPSRRSAESVLRWKWALLESDQAPADLWL